MAKPASVLDEIMERAIPLSSAKFDHPVCFPPGEPKQGYFGHVDVASPASKGLKIAALPGLGVIIVNTNIDAKKPLIVPWANVDSATPA